MSEPRHEIDGYILEIKGRGWLTKELRPTINWHERGVWDTEEETNHALDKAVEIGTVMPY